MNIYQDTSFYISTIGFNLPLDFKFDIRLGKAMGIIKPRPNEEVATNGVHTNENVKKAESPTVSNVSKTNIPSKVEKVVSPKTESIEKVSTVTDRDVTSANSIVKVKEQKHQSKDTALVTVTSKLDTVAKVKNESPITASREGNDKKDTKHKNTNVVKNEIDRARNEGHPPVDTKKEHLAKVAKQLNAEDSAKLKEKIILDAQKELERQNQFALERQKREAYEASQRDMMRYYENKADGKIEDPIAVNKSIVKAIETKEVVAQKKMPTEQKYFNYSTKPGKTIIKGNVLDGANQLKLVAVNVSIRPLNSIFSAETQTDKMGYFEAEVDSGGMYIISFFKTDYKISKQFIDLSDKATKEFTLPDVYLGESVSVDINRDMPAFFFFKNKTELTESVTEELNAIIVLLSKNQNYSIKLIGLAAADENFPKPLSTSRVQSIAQYLVSNGVKREQIKFVALGDTKHRSNCGLSKPCTSEDYDKDRAVVYLITK
jgi:outer membrane protein OmpA-like peptidoglycan-associated protein